MSEIKRKVDKSVVFEIFMELLRTRPHESPITLADWAVDAADLMELWDETARIEDEQAQKKQEDFEKFISSLTLRTANILRAYNIKTMDELLANSFIDLLKMNGMGRKSAREIVTELARRDLWLRNFPKDAATELGVNT